MALRKRFQNERALQWKEWNNGIETLLCDVTVVLNFAAFLR